MTRTTDVEQLLSVVEGLERMLLVRLADHGRSAAAPPVFRGRCLDPAYLAAVAAGVWSLDDEALLGQTEERLDALALSRVRLLDRRALRTVLRATALAVMTRDLDLAGWQQQRRGLALAWEDVVGPLPHVAAAPAPPLLLLP